MDLNPSITFAYQLVGPLESLNCPKSWTESSWGCKILYTKMHLLFKSVIPMYPYTSIPWKAGGRSRSDPKVVRKVFLVFQ